MREGPLDYSSTEADGPVSLRFHWFENRQYSDVSVASFRKIVSRLDSFGYYSVLMPYHNHLSDFLILAARDVCKEESIKYNIALRPSEISAEACARQTYAFSKIDTDRLILNIIYGSPQPVENREDLLSNRAEVKNVAARFLGDLYRNALFVKSNTEVIVSGNSYEALDLASTVDYAALDLESFEREDEQTEQGRAKLNAYKKSQRLMLVADLVVTEDSDISRFAGSNSIIGTEEEIIKKLDYLRKRGVTDILVARHPLDQDVDALHELVKRMSS